MFERTNRTREAKEIQSESTNELRAGHIDFLKMYFSQVFAQE